MSEKFLKSKRDVESQPFFVQVFEAINYEDIGSKNTDFL